MHLRKISTFQNLSMIKMGFSVYFDRYSFEHLGCQESPKSSIPYRTFALAEFIWVPFMYHLFYKSISPGICGDIVNFGAAFCISALSKITIPRGKVFSLSLGPIYFFWLPTLFCEKFLFSYGNLPYQTIE